MKDEILNNNQGKEAGRLLNRKQIASFLSVSERTIGNMIRMRRIPIIKWGRNVRFDAAKVLRALNKYEIQEV